MLAVVYRNATDMIFKIQLRKMTGVSDTQMEGKGKKTQSKIGFLMDPNVELDRRSVYARGQTGSFAQAVEMSNRSGVSAGESSPDVNMSSRPMLN